MRYTCALTALLALQACVSGPACNRADRLECGLTTADGEARPASRPNGVVEIPDLTTPGRDDFSGDCVGCVEFDFAHSGD